MTFNISDRKHRNMIRIFLFLIAVGLYAVTFSHSFNMDDELVTGNHRLVSKGISGIGRIITSSYYEDEMGYSYEYRPVTHISFAIEHQLFGGTPRSGHVLNALLYGLSCLVLFNLLARMAPALPVFPVIASLLFATHPMHTEVVASIKNRDEMLALLFALLAMGQAWRFNLAGVWWRLPMVIALMLMSLLSKSSTASFLLMVPLSAVLFSFHALRATAVLSAVGVSLAAYMYLRGWPLSWFMLPVSSAFAIVASLILWKLGRGVRWREMYGRVKPKGWPAALSDVSFPQQIGRTDLMFTGITALSAAPALLTGNLLWLALPLSTILLGPYWTGRHGLVGLLMLNVMVLSLFFAFYNEAMGLLMLAYIVLVLRGSGKWALLLPSAVAVALLIGFSEYIHDREHMMMLWQEVDLRRQPYLIMKFVAIWPILPLAVIYAFRDGLHRKRLLRPVMIVLMVLAVVAAVQAGSVASIASALATFFFYVFLTGSTWPRKRVSVLMLAVLIVVTHVLASIGLAELYSLADGEAEVLTVQEAPVILPDTVPTVGSGIPQDRPLAMVEFPLGDDAGMSIRLGTASVILVHYLRMMFIPWPQAFYYGYDEVRVVSMKDGMAVISAGVHILFLLLALFFARSHPLLSFGIVAYLASIFLFSNLISPVAGMMGDRLTYVASFGFCIAASYALTMLYQRLGTPVAKRVFAMALGTVLITWSGMTVARAAKWKDALTLMRHDIQTVPNSAQAQNLLASHLMKNSFEPENTSEAIKMRLEAIGHFKQAARIWPEFFNVWYDLGRSYMTVNQPDNALPAYKEAHRLDSTFYDATINVAVISEQRGNLAQAVEYYERCIRFNPEMLEPYGNLSYLHFREARYEESIAVNERAIIQNPSWPDPYLNIARTYEIMGKPDKAAEYSKRANRPQQ